MLKKREVYTCDECGGFCEVNRCPIPQCIGSAKLTTIEIDKEKNLDIVKKALDSIGESKFKVLLSLSSDGPSDIDIVYMEKEAIISDLSNLDFIFNDIPAVENKKMLKECLGIALLDPYKVIKGEDVKGLFIYSGRLYRDDQETLFTKRYPLKNEKGVFK
ncbi:hypothetical protein ACU3L3_14210 [Priestia endophytica]